MKKVRMGAIVKEVPSVYWYLQAGWKVVEDKPIIEEKKVGDEDDTTDTKKNVKRHR